MKISRLLNKKNFLIIFFLFFVNILSAEDQPVDIWNVDKAEVDNNPSMKESIDKENTTIKLETETNIYKMQSQKKKNLIELDEKLDSKEMKIFGLYDPEDYSLDIDMWINSDGDQLKNIFSKLNTMQLSDDATEILQISLLTLVQKLQVALMYCFLRLWYFH